MHIMNFAHGEIYMIGAYIVYYFSDSLGIPLIPSVLLSMLAMSIFGLVLERYLFRPLKGGMISPFIMAVGLILVLQNLAVVAFGIYYRKVPSLAQGSFEILGVYLPKDRIVAVMVAIILSTLLYLFLKKTKYGLAMIASAQNSEGAICQGINPNRMAALVMAIGCALAGAAGALAGSLFSVEPSMGGTPLIKGITIIVLGGMGSLPGSIICGMVLGIIDGILPIFFGATLTAIIPLLFVIVVLLFKPNGLFGYGA
jgi:branched-chain amino acid transport system permease protein